MPATPSRVFNPSASCRMARGEWADGADGCESVEPCIGEAAESVEDGLYALGLPPTPPRASRDAACRLPAACGSLRDRFGV